MPAKKGLNTLNKIKNAEIIKKKKVHPQTKRIIKFNP